MHISAELEDFLFEFGWLAVCLLAPVVALGYMFRARRRIRKRHIRIAPRRVEVLESYIGQELPDDFMGGGEEKA